MAITAEAGEAEVETATAEAAMHIYKVPSLSKPVTNNLNA